MRDALGSWRLALLALAVAAALATVAAPGRSEAQARAVVVLSTTLRTPVLTWTVERVTKGPTLTEAVVAGAHTTLARPGGDGPWPALVIVNGATTLGRREPELQRLAQGLARAGFLVLVPDLPGLRDGRLSEATVAGAAAVARSAADRADSAGGRVGLVGVSVGTSLALLVAEEPSLAAHVSVVAGSAPFADLANIVRLATTGYYRKGNLLVPYATDPFLAVAVARSLAAALPPGPERTEIARLADGLDDEAAEPLAPVRAIPLESLSPDVRSVVELLANREPRRFDALYAALPAEVRTRIARLSPLMGVGRLRAPVELATSPHDEYVPLAEPEALAAASDRVRLTVTTTLAHAEPTPSLAELGDLVRFNRWVVRSLDAAAG